jgi:hypothetical protein
MAVRRGWPTVAVVVGSVLAGAVVIGAAWFAAVLLLFDHGHDYACSSGELPATNKAGGSACYPAGSTLPRGFTWDPRGNYRIS